MMTNTINNKKSNDTTENTLENLQDKCLMQEQQIEELTAKLNWYEEQFKLNKQKRFGASSEKTAIDQTSLFNEAEQEADVKTPEPDLTEITYKRRKKVGKKDKMLEELPVEVVEYRLSEKEQVCSKCGENLHEMSKEVRRELKIIPAQVKVVEHVRYVYACRNCDKNDITTPIVTAKCRRQYYLGVGALLRRRPAAGVAGNADPAPGRPRRGPGPAAGGGGL